MGGREDYSTPRRYNEGSAQSVKNGNGGYPTPRRIESLVSSEGSRADRPWRTEPSSFDYPSRKDRDFTNVNGQAQHKNHGSNDRGSSPRAGTQKMKRDDMDDEVTQISRLLGYRAWNKWSSLRDCFRNMNKDHSGFVTRDEIRAFCRNLNYEMIADRYFDLLSTDGTGRVTYPDVVGALGPHITPGFEKPKTSKVPRADPERERQEGERQELLRISALLGNAAWKRFKTVKACFNLCDQDHNGKISREEMRSVFRRFQYRDDALADRFFDILDRDGTGSVEYEEISALLSPYIQPGFEGGTAALSKFELKDKSTPGSRPKSTPHTGQKRSGERDARVRTLTPRQAATKQTQTSSQGSRRGY